MAQVDFSRFLSYYSGIVNKSLANDGLLKYMTNFLETQFTSWGLSKPDKVTALAEVVSELTTRFNETSVNAAVELIKAEMNDEFSRWQVTQGIAADRDKLNLQIAADKEKLNLQIAADKEKLAQQLGFEREKLAKNDPLIAAEQKFNLARAELVAKQAETEHAKKCAIKREVYSYDDNLLFKKAEFLSNAVFGYASGGVDVPADIQTDMFKAINAITGDDGGRLMSNDIVNGCMNGYNYTPPTTGGGGNTGGGSGGSGGDDYGGISDKVIVLVHENKEVYPAGADGLKIREGASSYSFLLVYKNGDIVELKNKGEKSSDGRFVVVEPMYLKDIATNITYKNPDGIPVPPPQE